MSRPDQSARSCAGALLSLAHSLALAAALALAIPFSHAAESVKFRPVTPIYADGKGAALSRPEGLACQGKDLAVADSGNGRILTYTVVDGAPAPAAEITAGQIGFPIRVAFGPQGDLLVLDGRARKIARLTRSGEFKNFVEIGAGDAALGTVVPKSFRAGPDGTLYVLDLFGARVLVASADGKVLRRIPFPENYGFISDLALGPGGVVYLVDGVGRRVYAIARDGTSATPFGEPLTEDVDFPTAIVADARGHVIVLDHDGGGIIVLGPDGAFRGRQSAFGWKEGFLRYPSDLCLDERGDLFVADRNNNRIQVFVPTH